MMRGVAALVLVPLVVAAQGYQPEAKRIFEDGVVLFRQGDFNGAIEKFRASYALAPNSGTLLNLATALRRAGRDVEAFDAYQRYLRTAEVDATRRAQMEKVLLELRSRIGALVIEVNEPGAQIYVDGTSAGSSPLPGPIHVAPGTHRVEAFKTGFKRAAAQVDLPGPGEERAISLALEQESTTPVPIQPEPAPPPPIMMEKRSTPPPPPQDLPVRKTFATHALLDAEVLHGGAGARVGLSADIDGHVEVGADALLGKRKGLGVGAGISLWPRWRARPSLHAAIDTYVIDRAAHIGLRGGLRLSVRLIQGVALLGEISVQYVPTLPAERFERTFLVLGAGVEWRFF